MKKNRGVEGDGREKRWRSMVPSWRLAMENRQHLEGKHPLEDLLGTQHRDDMEMVMEAMRQAARGDSQAAREESQAV